MTQAKIKKEVLFNGVLGNYNVKSIGNGLSFKLVARNTQETIATFKSYDDLVVKAKELVKQAGKNWVSYDENYENMIKSLNQ